MCGVQGGGRGKFSGEKSPQNAYNFFDNMNQESKNDHSHCLNICISGSLSLGNNHDLQKWVSERSNSSKSARRHLRALQWRVSSVSCGVAGSCERDVVEEWLRPARKLTTFIPLENSRI